MLRDADDTFSSTGDENDREMKSNYLGGYNNTMLSSEEIAQSSKVCESK